MKIVIVGAGRVGKQLARELASHGHDLVMIDRDKAVVSQISELYDITAIHGDASDVSVLQRAFGDGVDMLIAVSESDEVNLIVSLLARKMGAGTRIARIRHESWFTEGRLSHEELGLDKVIYPERETVNHLVKVMGINGAFDYAEFAGGEVVLIGFDVAQELPIVGHTLMDLREQFALDSFLIIGIYRDGVFTVPHGEDKLQGGDKVWLLAAKDTVPFIMPIFKHGVTGEESVVIFGATRVGLALAEAMKKRFGEVTLIENDPTVARLAAEQLEDVRVIRGGGEETDILKEIGQESINCFIAVSHDERMNLMSGLLAKRTGVDRVAVVTNETEYMPVMEAMGLDVVANPLTLTAGAILRHIRQGIVHSVVKLHAGEAELIEYDVASGTPVAGKTLAEAKLPRGAVVGTILKGDATIIPDGSTILEVGSRVVVVATSEKIPEVEKLFVSKRLFF
ncbi:hypothetical protein MNBD_NITROSPINAE01-1117 [hydrothermal vent metagenome]|uniref:Trk system potassium uptake protein TrkA n=1 Tax=hydrothermal vent metagenome TaxID=652676 RepID=A0A3B1C0B1_9ZZZZ